MSEETQSKSAVKSRSRVKITLVLAVLVSVALLSSLVDVRGTLDGALTWIEEQGRLGALIFVGLYIVACVLVLPGSVLTLGAGAVYGFKLAFVLVSVGSTLGAAAAFLVGRYFAREWVAQKVEGNKSFKAIDEAVAKQGWKIVFLTRLTPVLPFNIQNYGYGVTKVRFAHYVIASWIGMMPGTVLYTYAGSLGGDAAQGGLSAGRWAMNIVALLATVAVTVFVTRIAKKALSEAVDDGPTVAVEGS